MKEVFLGQRIEHDEACNHFDEICHAAWAQGFVTEWIEEEFCILKLLHDCWDSPDLVLIGELVASPDSKLEWLRQDLFLDEDWGELNSSEFRNSSREEAERPYDNKYVCSVLINDKYLVSADYVLKLLAKAS